jgi:uncharacterized protein (DUF2236 family)
LNVSKWVPVRPVMSLVILVFTTTRAKAGHWPAAKQTSWAQATAMTPAEVTAGSLQQDVGEWRRGTRYSATSPELCLWVYATIVETMLNSYSTFVHPLDMNERAELYRESERFGQLYGVGKDIRPVTYQDFQDSYARTLSRLRAGDQARSVARMILRARLRGIPIRPWSYLLAAGLLPAPLRTQYGLRWSAAQRALWWLFTHAVQVVMGRLAPARLRFWGPYHVAVARCRPTTDPGVAVPNREARPGER